MLKVEDIRPRKGRYGNFCVLYTNSDACICCSEVQGQKLALFEPYEFTGEVKIRPGGTYLALRKAELFSAASYTES